MATGVISGVYAPDEHRIDLRRLVEEGGGEFIEGRVTEIRADDRELVLETGEALPYDVASFCLGSEVVWDGLAKDAAGVVRVKPVENTGEIRRRLMDFVEVACPESSSWAGEPPAARWRPTFWRCSTGWTLEGT